MMRHKKSPITTAMILAAGHGTRMRPHTDTKCKAMVEVGGKPLIAHMLARLAASGIQTVIVNVHTFADHLEAYLKASDFGVEIVISDERDALLETGGGVVKALPLLGQAPVLICNVDALWIEFEAVLSAMFKAWDGTKMDELFLLSHKDNTLGLASKGDFLLDETMRIDRAGKDGSAWYYAGIEIFKPELAAGYKVEAFSRNRIWDQTLKQGRAFGLPLHGYWMHVGDPAALRAAEAVWQEVCK